MTIENKIVWTEIAVADLKRACNFYSKLMNLEFTIEKCGDEEFGLCPHKDGEAAFGLSLHPNFQPYTAEQTSPLIYLNVNGRLDEALKEVEKHGGKILTGKEQIGPYGFKATIIDSEGNKIALHSN